MSVKFYPKSRRQRKPTEQEELSRFILKEARAPEKELLELSALHSFGGWSCEKGERLKKGLKRLTGREVRARIFLDPLSQAYVVLALEALGVGREQLKELPSLGRGLAWLEACEWKRSLQPPPVDATAVIANRLAEGLRALFERAGVSQRRLAERAGLTTREVSEMLRGRWRLGRAEGEHGARRRMGGYSLRLRRKDEGELDRAWLEEIKAAKREGREPLSLLELERKLKLMPPIEKRLAPRLPPRLDRFGVLLGKYQRILKALRRLVGTPSGTPRGLKCRPRGLRRHCSVKNL